MHLCWHNSFDVCSSVYLLLLETLYKLQDMAANVPKIKFNNGVEFPMFGLGTWKSKPGEVTQAVKDAIEAGYRHIDCAFYYMNEAEVGQAIKEKISSGAVKREELFITSKLWSTFLRPDLVEPNLKESLKNLGLDYLDLYLIHWPCALREGGEFLPKRDDHPILSHFSDVDYVDTWKAMEDVCRKGLAKSIGVSNFSRKQIDRILEIATIRPVNNQIECHPYLNQKSLIAYCKSKDIVVTAYSPLGSPDRPWAKPGDPVLTEDPRIKAIAAKYNKSPAQVIFRYILQNGAIPIPKSVTKKRIQENIQVFDFQLNPEDMQSIDTIDCNGRVCWFEEARGHPHWPFHPEFQ